MTILSQLTLTSDTALTALKEKEGKAGKDILAALGLKDQQVIEARVLKVISRNQAQLLIDGKKLNAATEMPLSENETLTLQVTRISGQQVLRKVEQAQALPPLREGLAEMRKLGREGPYAVLSEVLNTPLPESGQATDSAAVTVKDGKSAAQNMAEPVKLPETPETVSKATGTLNTTVRPLTPEQPSVSVNRPAPATLSPLPDEPAPKNPAAIVGTAEDAKSALPRVEAQPTPTVRVSVPPSMIMENPEPETVQDVEMPVLVLKSDSASTPVPPPLRPVIPADLKLAALVFEKPSGLPKAVMGLLSAAEKELSTYFSSATGTQEASMAETGDILMPETSIPESAEQNQAPGPEKTIRQALEQLPQKDRQALRLFLDDKTRTWLQKITGVLEAGPDLPALTSLPPLRDALAAPDGTGPVKIIPATGETADSLQTRAAEHSITFSENPPGEKPVLQADPVQASVLKKNFPDMASFENTEELHSRRPDPVPPGPKGMPENPDGGMDSGKSLAPRPLHGILPESSADSSVDLSGDVSPEPPPRSATAAPVRPEAHGLSPEKRDPLPFAAEQPSHQNVKRDLENIFTRLEASLEKQAVFFEKESHQTLALVKKIRSLVASFTLGQDGPIEEATVRHLVRDSGLMWENKLKALAETFSGKTPVLTRNQTETLVETDVKALALKGAELMSPFEGSEDARRGVGETLKTFSESLEKMQVLNSQSADDSGKYLLPLPYVHGNQIRFGQLLIDLDRNRNAENDGRERIIRVAFILDMSSLGPIQAGVSLYKKSLTGEFQVRSPVVKQLMDEALPELARTLASKGFNVTRLTCGITDSDHLSETTLVEKLSRFSDRAVSIRI